MRSILLAAGYGKRLKPLTDNTPKCLALINGKPLLQHWLEKLSSINFGPFLVNTHYLSKKVNKFIEHSQFNDAVTLSYEPKLLGTAGTLLTNLDFFQNQDGLLVHADNYCLDDLKEFVAAHHNRPLHCSMTMMVFRSNIPSSCGIVRLDKQGVVQEFYEKNADPPGNLANGAIYLLSAQLLQRLQNEFQDAENFSIDVLPYLKGEIFAYETSDFFVDIGTPANYALANIHAGN
ncbi:nucleotidyltransferase family protein [Desulfonatronovibrio magnus]|uniref:nucleotidyltransferase family protein n=1 Tax=Desulfonatronovibrio magnus TaxID=698827 RepID=UPI0005EB1D04|nr:nucleotidyltransferase family protein [Desulfonatronovibrio magnus]